jgi:hypothetical protein
VCVPQVFTRRHKDEQLVAWFWPDGPMWVQPGGGPPVEVTSDRFATSVELGWEQLDVPAGVTVLTVETPTGPERFELIR